MSQEVKNQLKSSQTSIRPPSTELHQKQPSTDSPIFHQIEKNSSHDLLHAQSQFHKQRLHSDKLSDFVEGDDNMGSQVFQNQQNQINNANINRLSQHNMNRLSEFHSKLLANRNKQRQSVMVGSLCGNFEDIYEKVEKIDDGQIFIRQGDALQRFTIGSQMLQFFDKDMIQQFSNISKPLYQTIHPYLSWFLVFYATINGACIPPWIMSIPAEKYLRISWRFFMQTIMMIPFLLYEKRNLPEDKKYQYTLNHIFKLEHIKKVYLVAFSNSMWFTMVLFSFEWNFISHALVLSGLTQFCFSLKRKFNGEENHDYESAGQGMVIFGILCIFSDTLTFDADEAPPSMMNYRNKFLLFRQPWQRLVIGNFTALLVSFLMFKMSRHQGEARQVYPQFLSMTLVFAFTSINMIMSSYFFAGGYLFHDSFWGWLGIFSSEQFSGFLFMSITLGMGNFVTQVLINKLFEPIVPQTVALFEPLFSTIILQMVGVQIIPRGLACIGYCFIVPGLFVIILGQHLLSIKRKQDEELQIKSQLMEEVKRLQELQQFQQSQNDKHDNKSEEDDSVKSINSKLKSSQFAEKK